MYFVHNQFHLKHLLNLQIDILFLLIVKLQQLHYTHLKLNLLHILLYRKNIFLVHLINFLRGLPITLHLLIPSFFKSATAVNKSLFIGIAFVTVQDTFILLPLFPTILNT